MMHTRRPIIGVMGSGSVATPDAGTVGRLLAGFNVHLLTGGGGGQMEAVAKSFVECDDRSGLCIGILPCSEEGASAGPRGYPNPYIEVAIQTHLWRSGADGGGVESRNSINVLTCTALVFLDGSEGTVSEALLAQRFEKPSVLFRDRQVGGAPSSRRLDKIFSESLVTSAEELSCWLEELLEGSVRDARNREGSGG